MIEFYTEKGHLDVANLYEPPFDFIDEEGSAQDTTMTSCQMVKQDVETEKQVNLQAVASVIHLLKFQLVLRLGYRD